VVYGALISAKDIVIASGAQIRRAPGCPPTQFVNTVTVTAEVSPTQSNTNLLPACVLDINGRRITTSSQSSATVECN
jgi:hypothetical protein